MPYEVEAALRRRRVQEICRGLIELVSSARTQRREGDRLLHELQGLGQRTPAGTLGRGDAPEGSSSR